MEKILARREQKRFSKKLYYFCFIMCFLIFVFIGVMCFISDSNIAALITMLLLGLLALFPGLPIISKMDKKIKKFNSYPTEALVYRDGHLFIITDVEEEILVTTIQRIWDVKDTTNAGYYSTTSSTGTLYIKTSEKKYKLEQIENVTATAKYTNEVLGINKN